MNVAEEYGTQSRNPTVYSTKTILNDANKGILTKWVNSYAGGASPSGYNLTDTFIEDISGAAEYLSFPWKPANKCLDDICDLNTALTLNTSIGHTGVGAGSTTAITVAGWYESCIGSYVTFTSGVNNGLSRLVTGWSYAGGPVQTTFTCDAFPNAYAALDTFDIWTTSGPHWIVDNSGNLRVKRINAGQTGWTHYFGDSAAAATLVAGVDFFDGDFQILSKEANIILYSGIWRRPANADAWTENNASDWNATDCTVADDAADFKINTASIVYTRTHAVNIPQIAYPSGLDWQLDLSSDMFPDFNIPYLHFWVKRETTTSGGWVDLVDGTANGARHNYSAAAPDAGRWYHISVPIGDYANLDGENWTSIVALTPVDWSDIHYISFGNGAANGKKVWIDGVHFGGPSIIRIARQTLPTEGMPIGTLGDTDNPMRFKVITDDVGKDDSLVALDDSGLMAQYAKSELYKLNSTPTLGKFTTPMIPTWLPGQFAYIGSIDYRPTKLNHTINNRGFHTSFEVTTDVTNSHSRRRFEDMNKIYAAIRPEYQDRQASSIKSGNIDIRIVPLEKAYNI
jgi:hypothetical protein